jgi:hypothetical protein
MLESYLEVEYKDEEAEQKGSGKLNKFFIQISSKLIELTNVNHSNCKIQFISNLPGGIVACAVIPLMGGWTLRMVVLKKLA